MKSTIHDPSFCEQAKQFQKNKLNSMSKNFKKSVLIFSVAIATFFSSCSNSDSTPSSQSSGSGSVTATIAGSAFQSTVVANIVRLGNTVTVQGGDATGRSIQIQVIGLTTPPVAGTYALHGDSGNFIGTAVLVNAINSTYSSNGCDDSLPRAGFNPTGTITFTEISATKITGTFQFNGASLQNCSDVKIVTSGTFSKTF